MHGMSIESIRRLTPTQTGKLYREGQALYLEGLAHSVSAGQAYITDKSRKQVVKSLRQNAERIRRGPRPGVAAQSGGLRIGDIAKIAPVDPALVKTSSIGKPLGKIEDLVKVRREIMAAKQKKMSDITARRSAKLPPGSKVRGRK